MITFTCFIPLLLAAPPAGADVLATYAGGTVTRAEYESFLLGQGEKDDESARRVWLETIALSESLETAAVAAGLDRQPQTAFRLAQIEIGALAAAVRQGVDRAISIGDAEVEAELKAEDAERFKARTVRLRNLFKRVPAGASAAARAEIRGRMEQLRKDLLAGADFEALAWRESDSQTRFRGGAMGYVPAGVLSPDVDRVIATLTKGDVSEVLASADGFTILRCDDIDEGRVIPVDEARQTIRQGLWSRASAARQAELRADLLREAAPRYAATGGDDASSAVDFQGGRITGAELRWLAGGGAGALPDEERQRLLEEQVVRVVAAARARADGLDRDPALRARVAWQRAKQLATEEIARRLNRSLVPPTDAEMRAHHQRNREKYMEPAHVDISLIAWPLEKDQARRRFTEAEAVLARLKAGELAFDAAARQASVHPSAANGGRIGLLPMTDLAQLGPNVFRTVQALAPGETSAIVQQDAYLYVVKLWERQPARPLTYEEAAPRVEKELGDARVAELQKAREAEAREALRFELARSVP